MAKREPDNLALDMMQCKADGFGCDYGKWKALQNNPVIKKKEVIPEDWIECPVCGKFFKPNKCGFKQIYCEPYCQKKAQRARDKDKLREYYRSYAEKRRAERKLKNESYA